VRTPRRSAARAVSQKPPGRGIQICVKSRSATTIKNNQRTPLAKIRVKTASGVQKALVDLER